MAKKILVADDELPILELIVLRLREANYEVVAASDGFQAVKMAHDQKPDLILLDVRMPAGGGLGVYDNLRKSNDTQFIPVIFITVYDNEDIRRKVMEKGARDFIAKPFKTEVLLEKVKNAIGE